MMSYDKGLPFWGEVDRISKDRAKSLHVLINRELRSVIVDSGMTWEEYLDCEDEGFHVMTIASESEGWRMCASALESLGLKKGPDDIGDHWSEGGTFSLEKWEASEDGADKDWVYETHELDGASDEVHAMMVTAASIGYISRSLVDALGLRIGILENWGVCLIASPCEDLYRELLKEGDINVREWVGWQKPPPCKEVLWGPESEVKS